MIANTYVVKPFGISEVKVIALKGEPGGPTQEQVNTAVEEYMDDHPEHTIPDGSITEQKLSEGAVTTDKIADESVTTDKLANNVTAPYSDNLVSSSYVSDSEPYLFRKTFAGVREDTEIVGGSVVWNQKFIARWTSTSNGITLTRDSTNQGKATLTGTANTAAYFRCDGTGMTATGRVYFTDKGTENADIWLYNDGKGVGSKVNRYGVGKATDVRYIFVRVATGATVNETITPMVIDLTLMFGSTVADYIYSLETATAGAGVAFFRSLFSKPYYAYNAGEIISVKTSGHKITGFNQWDEEWELGYYNSSTGLPVSATNQIRSKNYIPVIGGAGYYVLSPKTCVKLFYDAGYTFISATSWTSGAFTAPNNARYMRVNFGGDYGTTYKNDICINISDPSKNGTYEPYTEVVYSLSSTDLRGIPTIVDGKLKYDGDVYKSDGTVERRYGYRVYQSGDESLANAITDGTHTVYKLTTATTETTDPYTNPQKCYPDGTEEYIDTRDVPIPVGHNTKYMRDLKKLLEGIPDAPSANGTYVLKATVSSSGVTYAWIAG